MKSTHPNLNEVRYIVQAKYNNRKLATLRRKHKNVTSRLEVNAGEDY